MTEPCQKCGGWTANEDGHRDDCPERRSECADLKRAAEIVRRSAHRFPNSGHELVENALADRLDGYAVWIATFHEECEADANRMIRGTAAHYQSKILALTEQVSQLRAALVAAARRGVADTEKAEEALDEESNAHLDTQRALVLLANQLETHSVPFVPDAEAATAKARRDVEQFDKLFARGIDAALQAYQNAKAKRDAARAALPTEESR